MMQQPSQGPLGASRGLIAEDACSSESTHVCDYDNLEGQDQDIECMEMLSAPDWRVRRQGLNSASCMLKHNRLGNSHRFICKGSA